MMKGRHALRLPVRLACLVLAILLLWPLPLWLHASTIAVQASPFVAVCTILADRAWSAGIILGIILAAIAAVRKRWFCRYICPAGLLLEGIDYIGLRKNAWWRRFPFIGRYIALLTIAGAVVGYPLFLWLDPVNIICSQKVWPDTTMSFFTLLSVIFFVLALKRQNGLFFILCGLSVGIVVNIK